MTDEPIAIVNICFIFHADLFVVLDAILGTLVKAISFHRHRTLGSDTEGFIVVCTKQATSLRIRLVEELLKGLANLDNVLIMVEVVFFNIGDHRIPWQQIDEAAIAFVGFCDKPFALAIFGVAADLADYTTDDDRRIKIIFLERQCDHRGCSRFAMGTSHADGFLRLHQIAEHFRTMHHWDALFHGSLIFHVGFADRRGTHDDVDVIGDVFRALWHVDRRAATAQHLHLIRLVEIGAADHKSTLEHDFRHSAHTDAANSNKMNMLKIF